MRYNRITIRERVEIYRLVQSDKSARHIAKELGRHHSTISREMERNTYPSNCLPVHGYSVMMASDLANVRAESRRGKKSIVERTTRFLLIVPLKGRDAQTVRKAFARELKQLPSQVRLSMTYDQGSEMCEHKLFTKATK